MDREKPPPDRSKPVPQKARATLPQGHGEVTRSRPGTQTSRSHGQSPDGAGDALDAYGARVERPRPGRSADALSTPTPQRRSDRPAAIDRRADRHTGHITPDDPEDVPGMHRESGGTDSLELSKPVTQLTAAMNTLRSDPDDHRARAERDEAALRIFQLLGDQSLRLSGSDPDQLEAFTTLMAAYTGTEATEKSRSSLASLALVLGVSLLTATGAGALGALAVGDVLWKEAVKASIGGAVSAITALATERLLRQDPPPQRAAE